MMRMGERGWGEEKEGPREWEREGEGEGGVRERAEGIHLLTLNHRWYSVLCRTNKAL